MKNRIGLLLVLVAAGLMTSGASAVVTGEGPKQKLCTSIGCPDETDLECFKGKVGLEVGPVVIEGTVTCYEPVRQSLSNSHSREAPNSQVGKGLKVRYAFVVVAFGLISPLPADSQARTWLGPLRTARGPSSGIPG